MTDAQTQAYLRDCLDYSPESGKFTWKTRPDEHFISPDRARSWNTKFAGKVAGSTDGRGYREIKINDRHLKAHRIAWILMNGVAPDQIDHINGNRSDNRISNLRNVTKAENDRNRATSSANTSGVMGVSWRKSASKWQAQIKIDRRTIHLGYFDDFHIAVATRKRAERDYGFHRNHGRVA